jgi:hypothetical protein
MQMAEIEIKNYRFEYAEPGKGEPLVLVPGSAGDYRTWFLEFSPI